MPKREREGVGAVHLDFWCRDQDFGPQNVEMVANGGAITSENNLIEATVKFQIVLKIILTKSKITFWDKY